MDDIIKITNLSKTFGSIKAVDNISFKVKKGEFFAFLGVNGAGKSTTISIMCSEIEKDTGEIVINGKNVEKDMENIKEKIGVVYQNSVLDKVLTVYENLKYRAALYNITGNEFEKKYNNLSKLLNFENLKNRVYGKLSGGQKRRIDIARALINDPEILILDEPTTGLDPQTRKLVWEVITDLKKNENLTVFLTTHYMEEVLDADYVVILNSGKIVAEGTPLELKNKYTGDFIRIYSTTEELVKSMGVDYTSIPNGYVVKVHNTAAATELILKFPKIFNDYEIIKGNMDDVFLNATGIRLGEN